MRAPSDDQWPLKALVAILAVTIVVLALVWLVRMPPQPTVSPTPDTTIADASNPSSDAERGVDATTPQSAVNDEPSKTVEQATTSPDTGHVLYGTIRNADGALVRTGALFLYASGKHVGTESPRDGTYTFSGLQRGEHRLVSRIEDELPLNQPVTLTTPLTRLDLRLEPQWRLMVHAVTPDGKPLREAVAGGASPIGLSSKLGAYASHEPLAGELTLPTRRHVPEQLGRFRGVEFGARNRLPNSAVGVLTLPAGRPIHISLVLGGARIAEQQVSSGQSEITFTVAPADVAARTGTVRLRVVDGSGAPVASARVGLHEISTGSSGVKVDEDGRITIRDLSPGRLRLMIQAPDHVGRPQLVDVHPGADLDLGDVRVESPVIVGIEVPGNTNTTNVYASCLDPAPSELLLPDRHRISVEPGKRADLRLIPGRHVLHARTRDAGLAMLEIDTRALPPMPLRLILAPGAPLTFDVGVAGTQLQVVTGSNAIVHEQEFEFAMDVTVEVLPGDYLIKIRPPNGPPTERRLSVPPAGLRLRIP